MAGVLDKHYKLIGIGVGVITLCGVFFAAGGSFQAFSSRDDMQDANNIVQDGRIEKNALDIAAIKQDVRIIYTMQADISYIKKKLEKM